MKIENNASLLAFNTFGIDAKCKKLIIIETNDEIQILFNNSFFEEPFMIIGGGSNLLFTQDYPGNIIQLQNKGIDSVTEDNDSVYLRVAAGETWDDFIHYCIEKELYGAENLIGIPGWVGSSPVQNIGAYGVEAKDIIYQVGGYFIQNQKPFLLHKDECAFEY
ncbi:MAG: FAD-binding protein, partial [Bacteroidales bacterium]